MFEELYGGSCNHNMEFALCCLRKSKNGLSGGWKLKKKKKKKEGSFNLLEETNTCILVYIKHWETDVPVSTVYLMHLDHKPLLFMPLPLSL